MNSLSEGIQFYQVFFHFLGLNNAKIWDILPIKTKAISVLRCEGEKNILFLRRYCLKHPLSVD